MKTHEVKIDRTFVIHPRLTDGRAADADYDLEEAIGLAEALGVAPIEHKIVPIRDLKVANYFGSGQIEEIGATIKARDLTLVIVNASLSPTQQRNLERSWKVKVIDRTGLILEIFGLRAATKEGSLQVELARLGYERARLVRTWTHLERQRGGAGMMGGPGETQIESDRRILNDKITRLGRQLEQVRRRRGLQRQKRSRAPERIVALVGYTNAGKSTLFNKLTTGGVLAQDMLFATLDTTHRILPMPSGQSAVLSDTVGFISDLPTDLITAFRATLEEVREADLLLHVRDMSDPLANRRREEVLSVLDQIKAGPQHGQTVLEVWNKADLLSDENLEALQERANAAALLSDMTDSVLVSCHTNKGIETLQNKIEAMLTAGDHVLNVHIPPSGYDAHAWLHQHGRVLNENVGDDGYASLSVRLSPADAGKFQARFSDYVA